ncbi:MAG: hypothetical protein JSU72_01875 [Deltaproteobacteria bacterium]|nr:MAG: hypothetical protein JSU72_01875 [Deltaproteobacteria bacterium]
MEVILQQDKALKDAEVLKWAQENRNCRITRVPHWVIMALLEDIAHFGCHLTEQLVMSLDYSHCWVTEQGYLERTVEKLMHNILLASLYEDGHIEVCQDWEKEPRLFDFHNEIDIQIDLTPSGHEARSWEELSLFCRPAGAILQ